jgi:hypothetical protein
MKKPVSVNQKSSGRLRDKGGVVSLLTKRMQAKSVDYSSVPQSDELRRFESLSRLLGLGLAMMPKAPPSERLRAAHALEQAARAINKFGGRTH